jgi:hypothetical protein
MFWIESFMTSTLREEIERSNETRPPLCLAHVVPCIYLHFYESNIIVARQDSVKDKFYSLEATVEDIVKRITN